MKYGVFLYKLWSTLRLSAYVGVFGNLNSLKKYYARVDGIVSTDAIMISSMPMKATADAMSVNAIAVMPIAHATRVTVLEMFVLVAFVIVRTPISLMCVAVFASLWL